MTGPLLTIDTFAGRIGETFRVSGPSASTAVAMTLTSATTWGSPRAAGERQPFTIHLHGPLEPLLPQSIRHVEHDRIGGMDLFIVPVGPDDGRMGYEAIFS